MAFKVPSMASTREYLSALFKFLFNDRNVGSRRSFHGKRITFLSGAITQLHAHVASVQDDVMPDTASDDGPIDRWGSIFSVERKAATSSSGVNVLRVYGDVAAVEVDGALLTHEASNQSFRLVGAVVIPAAGYIDTSVESVSTGSATRLLANEVLEFSAPSPNIRTKATLVSDLTTGGFDAEQFGAYRGRVLDTIGKPAAGGTDADYVKWSLEVDGVTDAYCYANRAGVGTVDVVGLKAGSGATRILSGGELSALLVYLQTKAPAHLAGSGGALRVLTTIADPQAVDISITTNGQSAYAFDWDDSSGYTVLAWTAATRTLQFAGGALPATLAAGHRITLNGIASSQDGRQYVVESLGVTDTVVLETAPTNNPAATDVIYAGGPLVDSIRDAILAHMNGEIVYLARGAVPTGESDLSSVVGLEVLADPIGPANPAGVYGTWSGGLIRAVLSKISISKAGVRNVAITTPAADYEAVDPAYPSDGSIYVITPTSVIVRES